MLNPGTGKEGAVLQKGNALLIRSEHMSAAVSSCLVGTHGYGQIETLGRIWAEGCRAQRCHTAHMGFVKNMAVVRLKWMVCRYNTYAFNGQKMVVLSTASWLGGANPFLGVAFLATGAASLTFGAAFALLSMFTQYELGDSSRLSWNKNK